MPSLEWQPLSQSSWAQITLRSQSQTWKRSHSKWHQMTSCNWWNGAVKRNKVQTRLWITLVMSKQSLVCRTNSSDGTKVEFKYFKIQFSFNKTIYAHSKHFSNHSEKFLPNSSPPYPPFWIFLPEACPSMDILCMHICTAVSMYRPLLDRKLAYSTHRSAFYSFLVQFLDPYFLV